MLRPIPAWAVVASAIATAALSDRVEAGSGLPVDVYLVAGQSNAAGQGLLANLPAGVAPDPRAWLYHSPHLRSNLPSLTWGPLRPATEQEGKFGPELGFGNRMQQLARDRPVALIKHAFTATNLDHAWNPGRDANDRAHWGPQFETFAAVVDFGMKALRDKGCDPTIRGMIWQQGESDADSRETGERYAANLSRLIARVREQFHAPDMVFVYGYVLPYPNKQPFREHVRMAQGAIDQDSGSPRAVKGAFVVFTDDLNHRADDPNTTDPGDHIHLGTLGALELGRRMAETMARKGKLAR